MKEALIFLILLSFVVNEDPQCQPNEVFDQQSQKCEVFCKVGEVFNLETSNCEPSETNTTCPEGQRYNDKKSSCENIPKKEEENEENENIGEEAVVEEEELILRFH